MSHEMARLTAILDGIIARHRCALIFAHHDRKRSPFVKFDSGTDRVRGSTALTGWLSFCLSIDLAVGAAKDRLVLHWTKTRDAEEPLESLVVDFDRDTIDFIAVEGAAPGGKVPDQAILNGMFQAGSRGARGTDLITGFVQGAGTSDRWVRERIRGLVKEGKLLEFVPPEEKKGAKWYKVRDGESSAEEEQSSCLEGFQP
jgi:hypothetical protein